MVANAIPRFPEASAITVGLTIATANTAKDGTGTVVTVVTADATDGSWVKGIRWVPLGTNIVTVGRIFLNNGATNATATNNAMIGQITLPATTNSEVGALFIPFSPLNMWIPAGYKLNLTLGTTVAAGYAVSAETGSF